MSQSVVPVVDQAAPDLATNSVLKPSDAVAPGTLEIKGVDFNQHTDKDITVAELIANMSTMGFQASALAEAVRIINEMRTYRDPETQVKTTIFLGFTSNLISSGLREVIRYLVQHNHISAIVTSAGGIEEDIIKCLAPSYMGAFHLDGASLRARGLNRAGNVLIPNSNYCAFEDWVMPLLTTMLEEQSATASLPDDDERKVFWTPSKVTRRLGLEMKDESSVLYWAARHNVPVFCPALTDGSLGDMLFFQTYRSAPAQLRIDSVADIRAINSMAMNAKRAGMIVLGGGVVKHHIANACLMRNGADYAVYVNTGQEFDGSDAGARPDEAVSWGKIRADGQSVKIYAEATIVFPLIVAATFAKVVVRPGKGEEQKVVQT